VERLARRDADAAALPGRESPEALVTPENGSRLVHDVAR